MVITLRSRVINGFNTRKRGLRRPPKTVKVVLASAEQIHVGHLYEDGETYLWESFSGAETDIGKVDNSGSVTRLTQLSSIWGVLGSPRVPRYFSK